MPFFRCKICNSYETYSDSIPEFCSNCGALNGPWEKIRDELKIKSGDKQYIVYKDQEFGRKELKTFFRELKDVEGNPAYKYCEADKPMLLFETDVSGNIIVKSNGRTKNYFLLNDQKIESDKMIIKKKDKLDLFSSSKSKVIISFEII